MPTFRFGKTNCPLSVDTAVAAVPVASWVAVTVAPGTTAPDWSRTVPTMVPVSSCADAGRAVIKSAIKAAKTARRTTRDIKPPSSGRLVYHRRDKATTGQTSGGSRQKALHARNLVCPGGDILARRSADRA